MVALSVFAAATLLNLGLVRLTANVAPFLPYFPAVMAAALYGGRGPGYLTTGLGALACAALWLRAPAEPWHALPASHWIALLSFGIAGALVVELARHTRALTRRAQDLRDAQQADLDRRISTEAALRESETRLDMALQAAAMGTWEFDLDRRVALASPRVREILGADRSEAPGQFWFERIHPEDRARVEAEFGAAVRGESHYDTEFRVVVAGVVRWVRASALVSDGSRPRRMVGLAEDVTARKASMEEMKRGREELQTMLDLLPVGVAISHDAKADRITVSPNLRRMLRLAPEQNASCTGPGHEDIPYRCLRAGHEVDGADLPMQIASRTGRDVRDDEIDLLFADGETRSLIISAAPLFDVHGQVRGAIGTHVDVTALKRAQRSLEAADRQKDEFLATLAHELRNPMAPIRYATAMLHPDVPAPQLAQARQTIERQSAQMARLLDDLLDMSRITRNAIELRPELRDLRELAKEASDAARPAIEPADHRLAVSLPMQPVWVDGDPTRLLQVIGNLLGNAAKYTPPGGRLELALEAGPGEATLRIKDNGIGLAPDMMPRLFELFSQVHPSMKAAKGGLGIGLAVVKRLVELHGGRIRAESAGLGRGAEFIVSLPLAAAREPARSATAPAGDAVALRTIPSRQHVLVVDDNVDAADSLAILLRTQGLDVDVAHDGPGALAKAEAHHPEVVVLDVGLPGMDGHEIAREIRRRHWGHHPRIIAVTGWGQAEDRRRTREAGFDLHLVKPVDPDHLLEIVTHARAGTTDVNPTAAA
jgi:PAS domain S-box-containing protein